MLKNHKLSDFNNEYFKVESFFVDKIAGAFSRFDMEALKTGTDRLKAGDKYVEVGVQNGRSSFVAGMLLPKGVKMTCVDIRDASEGPDTWSRAKFFKWSGLDDIATFVHAPSHEAAEKWDGSPIAMMFIDGDHSYEGVKLDVDSWSPYVKKGGHIYFHDADDTSPGVEKLVRQLGKSKGWTDMTFYIETLGHKTSMASIRKV